MTPFYAALLASAFFLTAVILYKLATRRAPRAADARHHQGSDTMNYKHLTPELAITGQIKASDIPAIAAAGFRAIICNRPDGEGFGQPTSDAIRRAAAEAGLSFRYIPVSPGQAAQPAVDAFAKALDELPGEILAYCASGARSANLCAMAQARRRGR